MNVVAIAAFLAIIFCCDAVRGAYDEEQCNQHADRVDIRHARKKRDSLSENIVVGMDYLGKPKIACHCDSKQFFKIMANKFRRSEIIRPRRSLLAKRYIYAPTCCKLDLSNPNKLYSYPFTLRLPEKQFNSNLFDPRSKDYQDLSKELVGSLQQLLQTEPCVISVDVTGFREGSVLADISLAVKGLINDGIVSKLRSAVESGVIGKLRVEVVPELPPLKPQHAPVAKPTTSAPVTETNAPATNTQPASGEQPASGTTQEGSKPAAETTGQEATTGSKLPATETNPASEEPKPSGDETNVAPDETNPASEEKKPAPETQTQTAPTSEENSGKATKKSKSEHNRKDRHNHKRHHKNQPKTSHEHHHNRKDRHNHKRQHKHQNQHKDQNNHKRHHQALHKDETTTTTVVASIPKDNKTAAAAQENPTEQPDVDTGEKTDGDTGEKTDGDTGEKTDGDTGEKSSTNDTQSSSNVTEAPVITPESPFDARPTVPYKPSLPGKDFKVAILFTDAKFRQELNNPSSSLYHEWKKTIEEPLRAIFRGRPGFLSLDLMSLRPAVYKSPAPTEAHTRSDVDQKPGIEASLDIKFSDAKPDQLRPLETQLQLGNIGTQTVVSDMAAVIIDEDGSLSGGKNATNTCASACVHPVICYPQCSTTCCSMPPQPAIGCPKNCPSSCAPGCSASCCNK